jgi:amino acid transporter
VLGQRDLVLFYITAVVGMRWVATAAAAGPSALVIWVVGAAALFIPLALTVMELSSRYPEDGGLYLWTKRAFGDFAGFMTGWTYWGSNLTYLPGLLYFGASTALHIFGERYAHLQNSPQYFVTVALAGLALATALNIVGLQVGKWLTNAGAVCTWIPMGLLIVMGLYAGVRFGSATPITVATLVPRTGLTDLIFWSTIAFAFSGLEAGSFMGGEIVNPRRAIPRAIVTSGIMITVIYILGTLAILLALPQREITGLGGIMDAIAATGNRIGLSGLASVTAVLIVISVMGGVSLWLAAVARLLFAAGLDKQLPQALGAVHTRFGTPHVALLLQAVVAAVCVVLGQAGDTPRKAYDILVSLGVIASFFPYLTMFAAMVRLQREPAGPDVVRVPGGTAGAIACGSVGFITSTAAIVLAAIPPAGEPNPGRYLLKVVGLSGLLVATGVVAYAVPRMKRVAVARAAHSPGSTSGLAPERHD